eukprot:2432096-Prymnesium_polylepis.1
MERMHVRAGIRFGGWVLPPTKRLKLTCVGVFLLPLPRAGFSATHTGHVCVGLAGGAWGGRSPPLLGVYDDTAARRVGSVLSHLSVP